MTARRATRMTPERTADEMRADEQRAAELRAQAESIPWTAASPYVRMSDVRPEKVDWLWAGRIPLGMITVLDGDPELGKSQITLDLAARVSTGSPMPDGSRGCAPSGVVVLSAEDHLAAVIRPRLDAARADCSRIVALREAEPVDDLSTIEHAIKHVGARLVVIDPWMAFLPQRSDSHRDQDMRGLLAPLAKLSENTGAAVLIVRHLNKSTNGNALYRGGGSIGIIGAARSGLLAAYDPDDQTGTRRILAVTKSNLAKKPAAMAYEVVDAGSGTSRITWHGVTAHTASQLVAEHGGDDRGMLDDARDMLRDLLAKGPVPVRDVLRQTKDAGLSWRTVERAKAAVGARAVKSGGKGAPWCWELGGLGGLGGLCPSAAESVEDSKTANASELGGLSDVGGLSTHEPKAANITSVGGLSKEQVSTGETAKAAKAAKAANTASEPKAANGGGGSPNTAKAANTATAPTAAATTPPEPPAKKEGAL